MAAIKGVFFDLGGTLRILDAVPEYRAKARARMAELVSADDPEALHAKIEERYEPYREWALSENKEAGDYELWAKWLLPELPEETLRRICHEMTYQYRQAKGIRRVVDGGLEVIHALRQRGYKLGIISNLIGENEICQDGVQFIVLGTGDPRYEDMFRYYQGIHPAKVSANIYFSDELSHKMYGGCDAILVPSRFEPCGLTQLMALRYGSLPIVRETGGLKDTVIPYNEFEQTGTGFSFTNYNAHELLNTINYAKEVFYNQKKSWEDMMVRAMNQDYSWASSAKRYEDFVMTLAKEFEIDDPTQYQKIVDAEWNILYEKIGYFFYLWFRESNLFLCYSSQIG